MAQGKIVDIERLKKRLTSDLHEVGHQVEDKPLEIITDMTADGSPD